MSNFIVIITLILLFLSCDEDWCTTCDEDSGSINISGDVQNSDVTIGICNKGKASYQKECGSRDTVNSDAISSDNDTSQNNNSYSSNNKDKSDDNSSYTTAPESDRSESNNVETVIVEGEDDRNIDIGELNSVITLEVKPALISRYMIKDIANSYYGSNRISYSNNEIYISDDDDTVLKFSITNQTSSRIKVDSTCAKFTSISNGSIMYLGSSTIYQCTTLGKLSSSLKLISKKSSYYFGDDDYAIYDGSYYWIFSDCAIYFFDSFGNFIKSVDITDQMDSCRYRKSIVEFKGSNVYIQDDRFIKKYQKNGSELKLISYFNYETIEPTMDLYDIAVDDSDNIWLFFASPSYSNKEYWLYKIKMS